MAKIVIEIVEIVQRWRPGMKPDETEMVLKAMVGGAELVIPVGERAVTAVMKAVHGSTHERVEEPTVDPIGDLRDDFDPSPNWQVADSSGTPNVEASPGLPTRPDLERLRQVAAHAPAKLVPERVRPAVKDDDPFPAG